VSLKPQEAGEGGSSLVVHRPSCINMQTHSPSTHEHGKASCHPYSQQDTQGGDVRASLRPPYSVQSHGTPTSPHCLKRQCACCPTEACGAAGPVGKAAPTRVGHLSACGMDALGRVASVNLERMKCSARASRSVACSGVVLGCELGLIEELRLDSLDNTTPQSHVRSDSVTL
jgi:hypothetical protein